MRKELDARDRAIAFIARRQHGVISTAQLRGVALDPAAVSRRHAAGRLHRVHRGVYAVGHDGLSAKGRWKAATLACAPNAFLSHRSAAELWAMVEPSTAHPHLTTLGTGGRGRHGRSELHRSRTLTPAMTTIKDGIPVTRPGRTLEDLRRALPRDEFRTAVRQAEFLQLPLGDFELLARSHPERARGRVPAPLPPPPPSRARSPGADRPLPGRVPLAR